MPRRLKSCIRRVIIRLHLKNDMKARRTVLTVLMILVIAFIWGNSILSRETSLRISESVRAFIEHYINLGNIDPHKNPTVLVRKTAHFSEFFVLGILSFLRGRMAGFGQPAVSAVVFCAAVACLDETIQILSARGSMLRDAGIDVCGAISGIMVIWLLVSLFRLIRKRKKEADGL